MKRPNRDENCEVSEKKSKKLKLRNKRETRYLEEEIGENGGSKDRGLSFVWEGTFYEEVFVGRLTFGFFVDREDGVKIRFL